MITTNAPLVSVGIPAYNAGPYFEKCLKSILAQTYQNIEIIICDNASTDKSTDIVHQVSDPRIRYSRSPHLIGGHDNWNRCIEMARGEFVTIYHADDLYEPEIVREEVEFLLDNPEAGAVFSRALRIDGEDRVMEEMVLPEPLRGGKILSFAETLRAMIEYGNFLVCPTFMARRSVLELAGRFSSVIFGTAFDTGMWFQILEHAPIGVIDRPLMRYRVHDRMGTVVIERMRTRLADHFRAMDHFLKSPLADSAFTPELTEKYETAKLVDETRCLKNMILLGKIREARDLSRRIYKPGVAREYFRTRRRARYYLKRVYYSLLLETGFWKLISRSVDRSVS
jgi:glycosyltransferase involved in cell wall biosynthesis